MFMRIRFTAPIAALVLFSGLALAALFSAAAAGAEKRIALVVGNDRYANLADRDQLQKAVGDARAVGHALRQIGFEVIEGENLGRQALIDRLDEVARQSSGAMVFFFFSGHGVAVDGANYILPADMPEVGEGQITRMKGAAIAEEYITSELVGGGARVAVVVLDACRNNPFAHGGTRGVGGEKGLSPHEPPGGVFSLYAAGRGEAALDRLHDGDPNPNSVFTRALLPALTRPGLDLPALAVEVREEVDRLARSVRHDQRPAYYDGTRGGRIFLAGTPGPGQAGDASPEALPSPAPGNMPPPPSLPPPVQPPPEPRTPPAGPAAPPAARPGSYWYYEGSILHLEAVPDRPSRIFRVYRPSSAMSAMGARQGEVFFSGRRTGDRYEGTAYAFAGGCGRLPYPVVGSVLDDQRTIAMSGEKPMVDLSSCQKRPPVFTQFQLRYQFRID
jgi:hypothetical protein